MFERLANSLGARTVAALRAERARHTAAMELLTVADRAGVLAETAAHLANIDAILKRDSHRRPAGGSDDDAPI
jgi:hypothetical protein